jgi:molecular chaperone DnaJ
VADDYYEILGVSRNATEAELKSAYRRLARECHPDANPGDDAAAERFKEISLAYETLRDPERRRRYDMFGPEGSRGGAGAADFGFNDLFEAFFGGDPFGGGRRGPAGPARGPDAETMLELTLAEVVAGAHRSIEIVLPVECAACSGSGCEPGTHPAPCSTCSGSGEIREVRRSILGQVMTAAPCPQCRGAGRVIPSPCRECRGEGRLEGPRIVEIDVPAGVDEGQRLRLAGRGPAARRGGAPGDLYVRIRVQPHDRFERHGDDLVLRVPLALTQAVLGGVVELETFDGPVTVEVAPGTQSGSVVRLRGKGVPAVGSGRRGDLLVELTVEIPRHLGEEEAELFRRLAAIRGETVREHGPGLISRIRSAFQP